MRNLTVVLAQQGLLLNAEGFIPLLVDSLLLDPEHPRMENESLNGKTDWEAAKGPVQRVRPSSLPVLGTTSAA